MKTRDDIIADMARAIYEIHPYSEYGDRLYDTWDELLRVAEGIETTDNYYSPEEIEIAKNTIILVNKKVEAALDALLDSLPSGLYIGQDVCGKDLKGEDVIINQVIIDERAKNYAILLAMRKGD